MARSNGAVGTNSRGSSSISKIMFLTMLSRVFGFVRVKVSALYFGASLEADILNYVFAIPNNLRKIFAEGSLTTAFIPEFIKQIKEDKKHRILCLRRASYTISSANELLLRFLSFQTLIISSLVALCLIFTYPLMKAISGFQGQALVLACQLFSWVIVYILFVSISAIFSGVLNAHRHFAIPAFAPLLFSIGSIFSIIVWHGSLGIFSVVLGIWIGGILQIFIHLPSLYRLGYRGIFFCWELTREPALERIIRNWLPILAISVLSVVTQQVQFSLAARMREGDVSILSSSIVFFQLPFGVLYNSIAVVYFPRLSTAHLNQDKRVFTKQANEGLQLLILLLAPASLWLFLWAEPILTLILQGGLYNRDDTLRTASLLRVFSTHLMIMGLFSFALRVFYACGKAKAPFFWALFACLGELIFAYCFMGILGVEAIAWGTTVVYGLCLLLMCLVLYFNWGQLPIEAYIKVFMQVLLALVPTVILYLISFYTWCWSSYFCWSDFFFLAFLGSLSVASCYYLYYAWKIPCFWRLLGRKV